MSRRGEREATPVVLTLEDLGGRYSCNNSALHFKVFDRGELMKPDGRFWYLERPDDPGIFEVLGAEAVRELARGRSTSVGRTTITERSRTVYNHLWQVIPADQRAPVRDDYFHQTYGPAVLIPGVGLRLVDTLWDRAWSKGGLREPGGGSGDDDDGYEPARPQHRGPRRRPATASSSVPKSSPVASTRGRMGSSGSPGRRGRMGRS